MKIKKFFLSLSFFLLRGKFKKREEDGIEKTFLKENEINDSKIFLISILYFPLRIQSLSIVAVGV